MPESSHPALLEIRFEIKLQTSRIFTARRAETFKAMIKAKLHFADGRVQIEEIVNVSLTFHLKKEGQDTYVFYLREVESQSPDEVDYDEVTDES